MLSDLMLIGSPALPYSAVVAGLSLLAWVVGLIDVLCRDDTGVRLFPRWGWLLVVIAVPIAGTVAWLIFGRPRARRSSRARRNRGERLPSRAVVSEFPEYDRPGRFVPQDQPLTPNSCASAASARKSSAARRKYNADAARPDTPG